MLDEIFRLKNFILNSLTIKIGKIFKKNVESNLKSHIVFLKLC